MAVAKQAAIYKALRLSTKRPLLEENGLRLNPKNMFRKLFACISFVIFCLMFVESILTQIHGNFELACLYSFGSAPYLWFALLLYKK